MKIETYFKLLLVAYFALFLAGCAENGGKPDNLAIPPYASLSGVDTYLINCRGVTPRQVQIRDSSKAIFYQPDGRQKSKEEFCQEYANQR